MPLDGVPKNGPMTRACRLDVYALRDHGVSPMRIAVKLSAKYPFITHKKVLAALRKPSNGREDRHSVNWDFCPIVDGGL